jgi:hypothetical protein
MFYNYCKTSNSQGRRPKQEELLEEGQREELEAQAQPNRQQIIAQQLQGLQESQESIIKAIGQLQG